MTKIFCYNSKMFNSINKRRKRLVAAAKFLVEAAKKLFVDPDSVAVAKPFLINEKFSSRTLL